MEGLRSKGDRVRESVEILTKLKSLEIPSTDVGYLLTKQALDAWIHDGNEASHKIPFPLANRTGHLELPSKLSDSIKFVLRLDSAPAPAPASASASEEEDAEAEAPPTSPTPHSSPTLSSAQSAPTPSSAQSALSSTPQGAPQTE
jgi:hypothetical protein